MNRRSAFTLLEVLAALLIFALGAVVMGGAYLNVLNSYEVAKRSNTSDEDLSFARAQLLAISDLPTAEAGMEFDDGPRHVKWTAAAEPTNTTDLFTVTFTCAISDPQGEGRNVVETFMLLRPTWSDPATRTTLRQKAADRIAAVQGKAPQ